MWFNSFSYLLLLTATLALYFQLRPFHRKLLLIIASCLFYGAWSIKVLGLLAFSAAVDYFLSQRIYATPGPSRKRLYLLGSIVTQLSILGYFKYANFFLENLRLLLPEGTVSQAIQILLPPGISFYTFQSLAYSIDVYRGHLRPVDSYLTYFRFLSFFPQLVAGPIERAAHMIPQLDDAETTRFHRDNFSAGLKLILWGLFKKVIVADYCSLIVEPYFANPGVYDGWSALIAAHAFGIQVYCDFSAYSEIAMGSAKLFGIDLMRNFDQPFLATSINHFWRRWHISLSTWFRDYVYIPLGGNRHGNGRTVVNLVLTMSLSGLWHGADWHYVIFGMYHGILLAVYVLRSRHDAFKWYDAGAPGGRRFVQWLITFHLVTVGWVLFRANSMGEAALIYRKMAASLGSLTLPTAGQAFFLVFVTLFMGGSYLARRFEVSRKIDENPALAAAFYTLLILATLLGAPPSSPQFIYFQF